MHPTINASIHQVFESAYKSPLSLIILDDLERILQFVEVGPRFSNTVRVIVGVVHLINIDVGRSL